MNSGCGHGLCKQCTSVGMGIDKNIKGRVVGGIEEFPVEAGEGLGSEGHGYGPYKVWVVSNNFCVYDRKVKN